MKRDHTAGIIHAVAGLHVARVCFFLMTGVALAQSGPAPVTNHGQHTSQAAGPAKAAQRVKESIPALLVSDIHFEPFWDPDKVQQLVDAPGSKWTAILAAPPSPDREQRFASLQRTCHSRGVDTSFALLESSVEAMRGHASDAKFVTVSGDLISHEFSCKFRTLFPHSTPGDYRAFVEKTVSYVMGKLNGSFPGVPVYYALGNNDSDCGDYRLDAHSEFLEVTGREVTRRFPASDRQGALKTFAAGGYYSVSLPAPIEHARLLVLNDLFMSSKYATCSGKADPTAAEAQLAWLQRQLAQARRENNKVWVMGHIPPGVNLHATVEKLINICGGRKPEMFLSSEELADVLVEYNDVIELAIFAHTHMDELRLLKPETNDRKPASRAGVAVKMVSSISPVDGNNPSYTVARIDPTTARLNDYRVFTASNQTGIEATWLEEYDFARSFHETGFSSSSVNRLIAGFAADPGARTQASQDYIGDFAGGNLSPVLEALWPQYVCSLSNYTANAFRSCVCSTAR